MNDTRKEAICNALAAFIRQRPGLEWVNYATSNHAESRRAYFADKRAIERDKRDAETLLRAVRYNAGISADALLEASRSAYSGRLSVELDGASQKTLGDTGRCSADGRVRIDYCTGQYFPTEYRRAAAAVCAAALWTWQRENMPEPRTDATGHREYPADRRSDGSTPYVSAGDWLRRKFRQEFGSAMQKRYFD